MNSSSISLLISATLSMPVYSYTSSFSAYQHFCSCDSLSVGVIELFALVCVVYSAVQDYPWLGITGAHALITST